MSGFAKDPTPSRWVDRRTFLKRAGVAGASAAGARLLSPSRAGAQDAAVKADPAMKRGGTLRFGVSSAPAHFDVHQLGTVGNVGTQGPNFDITISAVVSTLMDPSDYFTAWYGKDGPQNYSFWTNPAFHDLARQIEREVDEGRRKTMVRQAELILESDPPLLPIAYEKIYDAWHNRVRGQNPSTFFGIYDVVRWDTVSVAS